MGIIDELIGKNCWFSAIDCWFSEGKWIASLEVQPPEVLLIVPQLVCGRKNMTLPGKLSYIHGDCHYDAESNSGLRYSSTQNWHPKRSSEQPRFPQSTLYLSVLWIYRKWWEPLTLDSKQVGSVASHNGANACFFSVSENTKRQLHPYARSDCASQ